MNKLVVFLYMTALIFGSFLVMSEEASVPETSNGCVCAAMSGETPDEPLLEHHFHLDFGCDENGGQICRNLCIALAESIKLAGIGPELLCKGETDETEINTNIYSKNCDNSYEHSGIAYIHPLCCKSQQPIDCESKKE